MFRFQGILVLIAGGILCFCETLFAGGQLIETGSDDQALKWAWDPPVVRWRLVRSGAPSGIQETIAKAFAIWEEASSKVKVIESGDGNADKPKADGYSDFFFNYDFASLGLGHDVIAITLFNGSLDGLAATSKTKIVEADILVNPVFKNLWITSEPTEASELDLQEILAHEIGHLFGLSHSLLIDSLMYPAKPSESLDADYLNLFRVPKRTLSQDDRAVLGKLYPDAAYEKSYGTIKGKVTVDGQPFVGAEIIAMKIDEDDTSLQAVQNDFIVKGMQHVSAYSLQDGAFDIRGLKSGLYQILVHGAKRFLNFSYGSISPYLAARGTASALSYQYWTNPDCSEGDSLTESNFMDVGQTATQITISPTQNYCDMRIIRSTEGSQICAGPAVVHSSCSTGGGGCALQPEGRFSWGWILVTVGSALTLFFARRKPKRRNHSSKQKINRDKPLL